MKREYSYDKENGVATVKLSKKGVEGFGVARLNPDDSTYGNEYTGLTIAEMRAYKHLFKNRAKLRKQEHDKFMKAALHHKKLYEEDLEREKNIQIDIESFIEDKAELYEKFKKPSRQVKWKELPDDFFEGDAP